MLSNLKTKNIKKEVEEIIKPFIEKLAQREDVLSIILLGGLGKRNFLDEFSDIDLSIVTYRKDRDQFPLPFEFHYNHNGRILEFNIHQLILEDELDESNVWGEGKIEAYTNAIIAYDTNDYAKKILEKNVKFDEKKAFNRLIWIIQQYKWRGQIHSLRCIERGFPEASHDLLNHCVEFLLEALYLLNKRYLPHRKWIFVFLDQLDIDKDLHALLKQAMLIKGFSYNDITERIEILNKVYNIILKMVYKEYPDFPKNPYEYYYRNFVQINHCTVADKMFEKMTHHEFIPDINEEDEKLYGDICFNVDKLYIDNIDKN